jgi:hypothetical protein
MKANALALVAALALPLVARGDGQWTVVGTSCTSGKPYAIPFMDVEADVVFQSGDRKWGGRRSGRAAADGRPASPHRKEKPASNGAEEGSYAAGIPGEMRLIYQPKRDICKWKEAVMNQLGADVSHRACYFGPATGSIRER